MKYCWGLYHSKHGQDLKKFLNDLDSESTHRHENINLIVHPQILSRRGRWSFSEFENYISELLAHFSNSNFQINVELQFDILLTEFNFQEKSALLEEWLNLRKKEHRLAHGTWSVRIADVGALNYFSKKMSSMSEHERFDLKFIASSGFNNSDALVGLCTVLNEQNIVLKGIVLSTELPKDEISEIASVLKTPLELQVFGPIPLFYSERKLLSPLVKRNAPSVTPSEENNDASFMVAKGDGEETGHKGFQVEENVNGTFLYLPKQLCLLDCLDLVADSGIEYARIDLDPQLGTEQIERLVRLVYKNNLIDGFEKYKEHYPASLIKGFFLANKTDTLFKKLKNQNLNWSTIVEQMQTQNIQVRYLGDVIDAEKDKMLVVLLKGKGSVLTNDDEMVIRTPEGKDKTHKFRYQEKNIIKPEMHSNENVNGFRVSRAGTGDIIILPWISGVQVGSVVYKKIGPLP